MNIAIIGSGGREHALSDAIAKSKYVRKVFCIPGNAGTSEIVQNLNIDSLNFDIFFVNNFSFENYISYFF